MLHTLQRKDAFLHFIDHILQFCHQGETLHQEPKEQHRNDQTDGCHNVPRGCKALQNVTEIGACAVKERREYGHLREDDRQRDEQNKQ